MRDGTFWLSVLILSLWGTTFVVWLIESEARTRTVRGLIRRLAAKPAAEILLLVLLFGAAVHVGGTKPDPPAPPPAAPPVVIVPPVPPAAPEAPAAAPEDTPAGSSAVLPQLLAGFTLHAVTTNASALAVPPEAAEHAPWTLRGGREDTFWIPATHWSFMLGTNAVEGVHVAACGVLSFADPVGLARPIPLPDARETSALLAPLWGMLDLVPPRSRFSHAVTAEGGLLLTWERLAAGGDTNAVVSLQAELSPQGDFVYRYAIPPESALHARGSPFTNFVIGAQHNGGGETWTCGEPSRLADGLELRWRALGLLDPEVWDHDGDGLSTADEILIHRTDPRNRDSDGDGLWDGEEVLTCGTEPLV